MRSSRLALVAVGLIGFLGVVAEAQTAATVTYTSSPAGAGSYQYDFTITNTGTTDIATFWVGWTPVGYNNLPYVYDLLQGIPSVNTPPTNWIGIPVADSPFGGYSVEWYGFGTSLAPGDSVSGFTFTISDSPSTMSGLSPLLGIPRSTSWVYIGSNRSAGVPGDFGSIVNASDVTVPEPAVAGVVVPLMLGGLMRRRRA